MVKEDAIDNRVYITNFALVTEPLALINTVKRVKTVLRPEELILSAVDQVIGAAPPSEREAVATAFGADDAIDSCKEAYWKAVLADGPLGASPLVFPYTSTNAITAQVTIAFGLRNESITITSGAQSFLKAAGSAFSLLRSNRTKAAITGGFCEEAAFAMLLEIAPRDKPVREITRYSETPAPPEFVSLPATSIAQTFRDMAELLGKGGVIKSVDNAGRNMVMIDVCVNRSSALK